MASCAICGKNLGLLDNTTSYQDAAGNRVEAHTDCLRKAQSASAMEAEGPTMYAVEQDGTTALAETSDSTNPVGKYLVVGAALVVGVLIVGALFAED
jgi:hypothetical protein